MRAADQSCAEGGPELYGIAENCFAGGGEMGALMRSMDWSSTPLGSVQSWPQSLRTSVSTCLNSRFAILVWWGPELVMLYNDAYSEILAGKHPAAMGRAGRAVWPEIWDIIGPMLTGVMERGEATWSDDLLLLLNRNGYAEECYFTFSYSPIRDESGHVGGIFTPVAETTGRVIGERRLRTLRDLATAGSTVKSRKQACDAMTRTLAGNPYDIPFATLYLFADDHKTAELVGAAGIEAGERAAPVSLTPGDVSGLFSAEAASGAVEVVSGLSELPGGPWQTSPSQAILLPITLPGQKAAEALLWAAISPRKNLDAEYRTFFELVAGQIANALATATGHEQERKRAEALAEIDRLKTAFFSNISHEFRTPLTLMLGPLEDMLSRAKESDETTSQLQLVHRNAVRLMRLVNTLLDFSRIEAGRATAEYAPVALDQVISDLASLFRSAVERAGLRLNVSCDRLSQPVYVDREMWEKVVLNLLSNALKYTFEGEIAVTLREKQGVAELQISDTGIGIPATETERIFERFHRVSGARGRTHEGSGIGLALVSELVKLHGGTIRVDSTVGQGSTFTVSLPMGSAHLPADRVQAAAPRVGPAIGAEPYVLEALSWLGEQHTPALSDAAERAVHSRDEEGSAPRSKVATTQRARVLIADDNADMRTYLTRILQDEHEVTAVTDGESALWEAFDRPPDLVLSDIMMPRLDGIELLRALRTNPRTSSIPVMLLSARAGEDSRLEGLKTGADDYLVKPFSARELLARVSSHLTISRVRREAAERERELRSMADAERARWHDFLKNAPALIAILQGPEHVFEFVNRAYAATLGRSEASELVGKRVQDIIPDAEGQRVLERLDYVYRTGVPFLTNEWNVRLQLPDGSLRDACFNVVYQPARDAENQIVGVLVHAVDVTELVAARRRVEESEARLSAIFNQATVGIAQTDLTGKFVLANDQFCNMVGRYRDELYELTISAIIHPDDWSQTHDMFGRLVEGGPNYQLEKRFMRPDGTAVWASTAIAAVRDESGRTRYVLAVAQDITARRQAEDELRRANEDLRQFAFAASHDLQEPLRMITSYTQLLLRSHRQSLDKDADLFADFIRQGTQRMRDLLHDLLAFTSVGADTAEPLEPVALDAVVQGVIEHLHRSVQESGASISVQKLPTVLGRETYLGQLFQNLLSNAIKYRSAAAPQVAIGTELRDSQTVFYVQDNGMGIEPEYHQKIFGVFKRLHGNDIPGTGIGLAICQRVVERSGGRIWVESKLGAGAKFLFTLPLASPALDR